MDIINFLRTIPLSRNLPEEQLEILAKTAREKRSYESQGKTYVSSTAKHLKNLQQDE